MSLIDNVKQICNRLANHGWRDLLLQHGLDILAEDLKEELSKELSHINRALKGFEDFSLEGKKGIDPGHPARSLLYHAMASPNVILGSNGLELTSFPTLTEIETVENFVFGINPPSLLELRSRANGADLAIVVFASEYRPAPETVHRKHGDLCFSRTGVARVGTKEPLYLPKNRGFLPFVEDDNYAFRVLPARYSAYIAIKRNGNENEFGPMRFKRSTEDNDGDRMFWVPLHKLFSGNECIRDLDLHIDLKAHHVNEKLRRIHLELGKENDTGWKEPDISNPPFIFTEGIADWASKHDYGTNVLVPIPHSRFVEPAKYKNKLLSFNVPKNDDNISSSLRISDIRGARPAPEYVHARHKLSNVDSIEDLNNYQEIANIVAEGGYQAIHYIDYTGDGWIEVICPELDIQLPGRYAAYSLVTAPDFFPNCDQRELMDWWEQQVPNSLREGIWRVPPETLSDDRKTVNIQLKDAGFHEDDVTMTAVVSLPYDTSPKLTQLNVSETIRHSYLPDAASGIYAPGWDVSYDRTQSGVEYLAAYGLGSPFPEDSKLCAALSTFWPAVAPDAARTFEPNERWPTVSPLTDEEIGQVGNLPWDGVNGPRLIRIEGNEKVEYSSIDYVDYVENALQNKYSLTLTGQVDVKEYKARVLTTAYAYKVLDIKDEEKGLWSVFSFREVPPSDEELQIAKAQTGIDELLNTVYRFEIYRHGEKLTHPEDFRKVIVEIKERATLFVSGVNILIKRGEGDWVFKNVNNL